MSGKEGLRNGPDMPWHCSAGMPCLRAVDERGDDTADAANSAASGRDERSMLYNATGDR